MRCSCRAGDAEYLATVARDLYASLAAADPNAVWLQMTWHFYYDKEWTDALREVFQLRRAG